MTDHMPKKKKNSPPISKWNFIARWVFGQIATVVAVIGLFNGIFFLTNNSSESSDLGFQVVSLFLQLFALITIASITVAYTQQKALESYTRLPLPTWLAGTVIAMIVCIIWWYVSHSALDSLFYSDSMLLPRTPYFDLYPIAILPILAQTWILMHYISFAWIYGIISALLGILLITVWVFSGINLIFMLVIVLYLFIPAYVLSWLFSTHRK